VSPCQQVGYYYELFVPLHLAGVGFHLIKGQNVLRRMGATLTLGSKAA
jgi:hypothetical protein